jgi:hypothetical protein
MELTLEVAQPANETDVCREQSGKPRAGSENEETKRKGDPSESGAANACDEG